MSTTQTVTTRQLLRETWDQMAQHSAQLLPIMGLIWLVQIPSFISEELFLPTDVMEMMGLPPGAARLLPAIVVMLATYLGPAWSAVGWHRLCLLDEQPGAVLPRWHTGPVISYFFVWLFLPVLTWGVPILAVVIVGAAMRMLGAPAAAVILPGVPAAVAAVWLTLRLSPVQVSRAAQAPLGLSEAMRRTAPISGPILRLSLLGVPFAAVSLGAPLLISNYFLLDASGYYVSQTAMIVEGLILGAMFFLLFLVSISLFNTIYRRIFPDYDTSVFA